MASCQRRRRLTGRTGPGVTFSLEDEAIASNALNGRKARKNARLPADRCGGRLEADRDAGCSDLDVLRVWMFCALMGRRAGVIALQLGHATRFGICIHMFPAASSALGWLVPPGS